MKQPPLKMLMAAATALLAVSSVVHLLTYFPSSRVRMAWTWPLHVATLAVWGGVILCVVPRPIRRPRPPGEGMLAWTMREHHRHQQLMRRMLAMIPLWARAAVLLGMFAAAANFIVCLKLLEGGAPTEGQRGYVLESHGIKIRDLSEGEYRRYQAYEVRLFSSAWLTLSLAAVVCVRYLAPRVSELATESRASIAVR